MIQYARVYKSLTDNNLLRAAVHVGHGTVVMINVIQDNTQSEEFTVVSGADWTDNVGGFDTRWEAFGDIVLKDQCDAYILERQTQHEA